MSTTDKGRLEGIHDIMMQPLLQDAGALNTGVILFVSLVFIVLIIASFRFYRRPLSRCRSRFRKATRHHASVHAATLARELLQILQQALGTRSLQNCNQEKIPASLSAEEWQSTIQLLNRACYSGEPIVDLTPSFEPIRKILWPTKK
jgi:hypothetical protein